MKIQLFAAALALATVCTDATAQIRDQFGRVIDPKAAALVDKNGAPIDIANPLATWQRAMARLLIVCSCCVP